jgi:hypothetical protein
VRYGNAVHSVPIRVLASYGLVGGLLYVVTILGMFRVLGRGWRNADPAQRAIMVGGQCALIASLIDAGTHTSGLLWYDATQAAIFGAVIGSVARPATAAWWRTHETIASLPLRPMVLADRSQGQRRAALER